LNEILQKAKKDRLRGSIRIFFKTIKKYSLFNPSINAVKSNVETILIEPEKKIIRWKEYFANLLNGIIHNVPPNPIKNAWIQQPESLLNEVSKEEVKEAIRNLKNLKAPVSDNIPSELIKYGGDNMHTFIYKLCHKV